MFDGYFVFRLKHWSISFSMVKKCVKYSLVDAFTDSAFKGNPAAVCLLEEDRDDQWLQDLAAEFNLYEKCYLTWLTNSGSAPRTGECVLCNLKPENMWDSKSEAMVPAASDSGHTTVLLGDVGAGVAHCERTIR